MKWLLFRLAFALPLSSSFCVMFLLVARWWYFRFCYNGHGGKLILCLCYVYLRIAYIYMLSWQYWFFCASASPYPISITENLRICDQVHINRSAAFLPLVVCHPQQDGKIHGVIGSTASCTLTHHIIASKISCFRSFLPHQIKQHHCNHHSTLIKEKLHIFSG